MQTIEPTGALSRASGAAGSLAPKRGAPHLVELQEPLGYRVKKRLLGPPLRTDRLAHERLGKPTALAVFASDNLSSSAYATEEILRVLVPVVGVAAFSLVLPITIAMLAVLALLILSYRQTIKEYPSAGGAYIVTRDNFGLLPAQVAGVALLTDYVLTVSVSVAAGSAALASAFESMTPYILPIAIGFVVVIAAGNLKGVRESGIAFSVPTYFFILNMGVLMAVGGVKMLTGGIQAQHLDTAGMLEPGTPGSGILYGASLFVVLHAFASGGAAVTGVEAISNGVPAFKEPAWKNARSTLVVMGSLLGLMFLALSVFASKLQTMPFEAGTPTVISQIGRAIYGESAIGTALFFALQAGTMLILVLAANTSFADFPRLASFHAGDNFMPRQLTKRGHRLVFSNGILFLAVAAIALLVITGASVERLIPLYAIGVFLSFTLSQSGMARHHVRTKEPGWRRGLVINGAGAVISGVVCVIIAVTKFTHGAWAILILVPVLVFLLVRLNRQYVSEETALEAGAAAEAVSAPVMRHQVVLVLVDELNMASARALQYARTLNPDELTAVHFDLDPIRTEDLTSAWSRLGMTRVALDIVSCPDRRLEHAAAEVVARHLVAGDTEVTVLIPRREYSRFWHRFLHDRTADSLVDTLSGLPHCNVTLVPFHIGTNPSSKPRLLAPIGEPPAGEANGRRTRHARKPPAVDLGDLELPEDRNRIADTEFRQRVRVVGVVHSMRVKPRSGTPSLEINLIDDSGMITAVFFGRRKLAGVHPGSAMMLEGMIGEHHGVMAMLNPMYTILAVGEPKASH